MASVSSMDDLGDRIITKFKESKFGIGSTEFLPHGCLDELITAESVTEELEIEDYPANRESKALIEFILEEAKKVFAISLISGVTNQILRDVMASFMQHRFADASLPIKHKEDLDTLPCFLSHTWNKRRKRDFWTKQWSFLAPLFSKKQFKMELEPDHILPFIWKGSETKESEFSQVYEVTIHESHHEDPILTVSKRRSSRSEASCSKLFDQ